MPDGEGRIDAWRRALFLFEKTTREIGPFFEADYHGYYLEGRDQEGLTPDLFGFNSEWYLVGDVTSSANKHPDDVAKYSKSKLPKAVEDLIAPSESGRHIAGAPFVLTNVEPNRPAETVNVIVTAGNARAELKRVEHEELRVALANWAGFSSPIPSFGLTAVPESTPREIKDALVGIVKWAAIQNRPVDVDEIVAHLLGDLYDSFSRKARSDLKNKVEGALADLQRQDPKTIKFVASAGTLEITKDYLLTASRPAFTKSLLEWTGLDTSQVNLRIEDEDSDETD